MSISKIITTTAAVAGIAAMHLVTLNSAAQAYDGRGNDRWRSSSHGPAMRYAPPARHAYQGGYHRDHSRNKNLGRGIAIGLGALIVGGILAAEANRQRHYDID